MRKQGLIWESTKSAFPEDGEDILFITTKTNEIHPGWYIKESKVFYSLTDESDYKENDILEWTYLQNDWPYIKPVADIRETESEVVSFFSDEKVSEEEKTKRAFEKLYGINFKEYPYQIPYDGSIIFFVTQSGKCLKGSFQIMLYPIKGSFDGNFNRFPSKNLKNGLKESKTYKGFSQVKYWIYEDELPKDISFFSELVF